jgi:hypothetical protein
LRAWTFTEEAKLRELVEAGGTWVQIGKKLGRTGGSAQKRAYRRGIVKKPVAKPYRKRGDGSRAKPLTERDEFILRALVQQGEKWETIAWVLDAQVRQVLRMSKRRGLVKQRFGQ